MPAADWSERTAEFVPAPNTPSTLSEAPRALSPACSVETALPRLP
jgi:hypothetical protein